MHVAICGIDGSGKTRLARALARRCSGLYRKQRIGRCFDRAIAQWGVPDPRSLPSGHGQRLAESYAEDFVAYAARYALRPPAHARPVFSDRWRMCVEVFADVFAEDRRPVLDTVAAAPLPSLQILLDVPPAEALRRIRLRGSPDWDETPELLQTLRTAYRRAADRDGRTMLVDALMPPERVLELAWELIGPLLSPGRTSPSGS